MHNSVRANLCERGAHLDTIKILFDNFIKYKNQKSRTKSNIDEVMAIIVKFEIFEKIAKSRKFS